MKCQPFFKLQLKRFQKTPLRLKYYSLHYISICARWAWFLPTLPDDLIPLYKQKYTTAQAISKVVASGKRISPGSSIPFEIARIYRLKKKKPKRKYVNDETSRRRERRDSEDGLF